MTRAAVTKIARATAALVGLQREIRDEDIVIDPRFCGPDYGLPDEATIAAIRDGGAAGGDADRPGVRGQEHGRPDRHGAGRRDRAGRARCSTSTSAAPRR